MDEKYIEYEINESDYFIWCILNQIVSEDQKITKTKQKLINLLESNMYDKKKIKGNFKDTKLLLRLYY